MSKQKYKKEMKIVIFLLVLYPLAKCFYSVFTLPLSGFVWKNNNLGCISSTDNCKLLSSPCSVASSHAQKKTKEHSLLETPAVKPTKNGDVSSKYGRLHISLSLQLPLPLAPSWGEQGPENWDVLMHLHMPPKKTQAQGLNGLQQSHSPLFICTYLSEC